MNNERLNYRLQFLGLLAELQRTGHKCNSEISTQLAKVKEEIDGISEDVEDYVPYDAGEE